MLVSLLSWTLSLSRGFGLRFWGLRCFGIYFLAYMECSFLYGVVFGVEVIFPYLCFELLIDAEKAVLTMITWVSFCHVCDCSFW
jgi:hypothetical protein